MFPKKDMASEKAMIEQWTPEEVADGNRGLGSGQEIEMFEEGTKDSSSEVRERGWGGKRLALELQNDSHSENNVKEAVNSLKDRETAEEPSPVPSSKPPLPPGGCGL